MWFKAFFKRNFRHLSFILILLIIPLTAFLIKFALLRDSSLMKVGYSATKEADKTLLEVFEKIKKDDSTAEFSYFNTPDSALDALESGKVDTVWVFEGDFQNALENFYSNKTDSVVTVLTREKNELTPLFEEKLFCFIYPYISKILFHDYMKEEIDENITQEELDYYYSYKGIEGNIAQIKTVDSDMNSYEKSDNFVMSTLRGILSLIVLLSALTSALYTNEEKKRGLFSLFTPIKRLSLFSYSVLSAVLPTSLIYLITVYFSGTFTSTGDELLSLFLLIFMSLSLSLFLLTYMKNTSLIFLVTVIIFSASLIFSPIFVNTKSFPFIQSLLPTYHYLYSVYEDKYIFSSLIYSLVLLILTVLKSMSKKAKIC